ncbi:IS3 family transposase [Caproicibacterium amylolyticum]|uniref:IS3 family transposase n=1 Tax=Caproicibacterium amylolyticum TaxID=2766537 RepID=A0A7G9WFA9_9FIRM|nr:IS3 family transposase [Caproicibacterium amylolyticum]QNO17371.1 IS3 family transposase [Caproicibacterium amylolyticum]
MQKFDSMEQFKAALIEYLDYYNNRRIKAKLNGLSPVEYRIQTVQVA